MTLKAATALVIAGLMLNSLVIIGVNLHYWASAPTPPPIFVVVSVFSTVALQLCLLLFFFTLYRKQRVTNP